MEVIWTPQAVKSYKEVVDFVDRKLGRSTAEKVRDLIRKRVEALGENSMLGKKYKDSLLLKVTYRELVVHRRCKVFYFVRNERIYVILIWDTRQDLAKLRELLFLS